MLQVCNEPWVGCWEAMHAGPSSVPSWVGPRRGSSAEPAQSVEHQCHNGNGEPRRKGPVEESLLEIMVTPRQVDAVSDRDDASTSQETHQQATMSIKGVEACCGQDPGWLAEAASVLAGASKHRPLASIAVDGGQVDAETVAGVHVAVRLRPFHGKEDQSRALEVRRSSKDQSAEVVLQGVSHPFPAVFEREDNEALHLRVGRRLVDSILEGYNGTLLAYGQTGSGKTYTLGEADLTGTPREGLMPRMLRDLFSSAAALPQSEFTFELRYVQVYLETIYDLLGEATSSSDQPIVTMRENACSVQLQGCSVVQLQSVEEALRALETGARRLRFARCSTAALDPAYRAPACPHPTSGASLTIRCSIWQHTNESPLIAFARRLPTRHAPSGTRRHKRHAPGATRDEPEARRTAHAVRLGGLGERAAHQRHGGAAPGAAEDQPVAALAGLGGQRAHAQGASPRADSARAVSQLPAYAAAPALARRELSHRDAHLPLALGRRRN